MLPRITQHVAAVMMAALRDLVGNVVHFEHVRSRAKIGYEGAAAGDALDVALIGEFAQRPIRRHARYPHALDEFVLRRHPIVRAQFP